MKVLITGGAGFIGTHTARALLARGDEVRILDALTPPVHRPGFTMAAPEGAESLHGDVRSKADWESALAGVDAVVHLAAYQDYLPDFSTFFHVNAAGTALGYEVIVERGLDVRRVVVASSQAVYGEGAYRCDRHGVVAPPARDAAQLARGDWEIRCPHCRLAVVPAATREGAAEPRNSYGISKLAAERLALALGETYGIETVAIRYSIVHGAGQSPRNAYSGLLRSACLRLLAGRRPLAFEDGRQLRDYVAIDDAVRATLIALDHPDAPGRAYNVGGGRAWSVLEVIEALNALSGVGLEPELPGTYRVGDVRHISSDVSAMTHLGWEPRADLTEVWRGYWRWLGTLDLGAGVVEDAYADMRRRGVLRDTAAAVPSPPEPAVEEATAR